MNPVRTTQLVEIAFRSRSPELAAKVANGFADAYIDWGIENRTRVAGKASTFFAAQIETLKQEIQDKENQLQAYSRRTDIVSLDPATNVTLKRLEALNQDYINTVSERISREARLNELQSATGERAADVLADPLVAEQRCAAAGDGARLRLQAQHLQARMAGDGRAQGQDRAGAAQPEDGRRERAPPARATARAASSRRSSAASRR